MTQSLLTVLVLFGATFISSTFGFGSALFAMPLLTLLLGLKTATPLFGLVGLTVSTIVLVRNWRSVEFASAWRLVLMTLLGIPVGVVLVEILPGSLITHALGVFLVAFGLYRLANLRLIKLKSPIWAMPFGFAAGILGGAYNTSGPPVVIYGEIRRWPPTQFRATLQGYFWPTGIGIVTSHGVGGLWTPEIFQIYGLALPGVLGAIAIGSWLNLRLTTDRFQSLLSGLLILLGVLLWV